MDINNLDSKIYLRESIKHIKTIFGELTKPKLTFCIDVSGSMHKSLKSIKEHLLEKLLKLSYSKLEHKFNVVMFNSSAMLFSSKHILCNYKNIHKLARWIADPIYDARSNLLYGLQKSFDDNPDAVYLVCDGYPNNDRREILANISHISKGRPIHCIMMTHSLPVIEPAFHFMEEIANITNGSITVVSVRQYGALDVLMPVMYSTGDSTVHQKFQSSEDDKYLDLNEARKIYTKLNTCHPMSTTHELKGDPLKEPTLAVPFVTKDPMSNKPSPFYHPYNMWYWPQYWVNQCTLGASPYCLNTMHDPQFYCMSDAFRKSRAFIGCDANQLNYQESLCNLPAAGTLLINRQVLAANYRENSEFYLGRITGQVSCCAFLVQLDCYKPVNEVQKTDINDILDLDDLKRHAISIGDYVLAPFHEESGHYRVAQLISGSEFRSQFKGLMKDKPMDIRVRFVLNEEEKAIPGNTCVYLSNKLRDLVEHKGRHLKKCADSDNKIKNKVLDSDEDEEKVEESEDEEKEYDDKEIKEESEEEDEEEDEEEEKLEYEDKHDNESNISCRIKCCGGCCNSNHPYIKGRINYNFEDDPGMTEEQIEQQIKLKKSQSSSSKTKEEEDDVDQDDMKLSDGELKKYCLSGDKSSVEHTNNSYKAFDTEENYRWKFGSHAKDAITETDYNWAVVRLIHKQQNTNRPQHKSQWRYWGHKPIPDLIDPPTTEPYKDPEYWGGPMPKQPITDNEPSKSWLQWPSVVIKPLEPHSASDISPSQMYNILKTQSKNLTRYGNDQHIRYEMQPAKYPLDYPSTMYETKPYCDTHKQFNLPTNQAMRNSTSYNRELNRCRVQAQVARDADNYHNYLRQRTTSS